jgi:uncharacterized membrane protein
MPDPATHDSGRARLQWQNGGISKWILYGQHVLTTSKTSEVGVLRREWRFGSFLILSGILGLAASLALSIEKVEKLQNPLASLSCDVSVLVQCSANLESAQGQVFGFPNPFLGLIGFSLVLGVGAVLFAAPRLAPWFWVAFNVGVAGAAGFVIWLIGQSIFVLGTLCPWCLVVWLVTIPLFVFVTGRNAKAGIFGPLAQRWGLAAWPWLTLVVIVAYTTVAALAEATLNILLSVG